MPRDRDNAGWSALESGRGKAPPHELAEAFASCFSSPAGMMVMDYLRRTFLSRRVPPTAGDAVLRHVEGQRSVVAHIQSLIEQGLIVRRS
ncbi:MAG TPA: hypothetical protein ENJ83_04765 [Rhodospirillales bacterium]|nr:hypothetical protein [Rhodospirillales bacterium]